MTDRPPSPAVIDATTEVLELAALLDNRVAAPDKARIMAWSRQVARHSLPRDDMLDAVQAFYDRPGPQPVSVGDVIDGARRIKRDRIDREQDAQRDERAAQLAIKAETDDIAAAVHFGQTRRRTPRLDAAERALQTCTNRAEAMAAMREFFAAKREASRR